MTDEVRNISVVVQSTQAEKALIRMGLALQDLNGATGKTDAELRKVDRTIDRAASEMIKAARSVAQLKGELKAMGTEITRANNANVKLSSQITINTRKLAEQKQIIATQKSVILSLAKENLKLSQSYDKVTSSAARAANATNAIKPRNLSFMYDMPLQQNINGGYSPGGAVPLVDADALKHAAKGLDDAGQFANALRYQLYDVAATFGIMGAAATAAGVAVFRAGISWDKNFANVIRTSQVTGHAVEWLREEFLQLQTTIPVTSADLATIATLGAQMGVSAANLANFTEITAKFSATAGTNVDESATALSRLDQLLPDVAGNYERLASTILKTGVNAVATEQQIIRGTGQIAAMGRIAGLTTPEIVGLASALSSLGFSPELQRSIITSSFSRILTATSEVTSQTEKFGAVLNMTGKQFQSAWREDAIGTYRNLLEAIASRGDAVSVLQDLGLASQRLTPNLLKLGQNTEVLNEALADTRLEWGTNAELTRQYGVISDTVAARIQILGQTWESLLVTLDESDTIIKPLVDGLTGFLGILRDISRTPGVSTIASIGSAIVVLAGITALGAAGLAAMSAGYIALTNANIGLKAALATDAAALVGNTAARAGNTAATVANTGAVGANTAAMAGNAAATSGAAGGLLNFTSKTISSLPAILKMAGIIGIATAAVAGLITLVSTSPDWGHDLRKALNGIDTPEKTVAYDAARLNEAAAAAEEYAMKLLAVRSAQTDIEKLGAQIDANGGGFRTGFGGALATWLDNPGTQTEAITKDLTDQILELGTLEEKYAAVNHVSQLLGVTQEHLLSKILPDLGSALGSTAAAAAEAQDEMIQLESAQALWAANLLTTDENLASLRSGVQSAAGDFLDFGDALQRAYDVSGDEGTGGGLSAFLGSMSSQISSFESFYGNLGQLVQRGGVQLAGFFAEQGPSASQALVDSLALSGDQIAQIEQQMSLAAFYASEEFSNTFAQNNAILANIWRQTNSTEAVAAFNAALSDSMKGGSIDPAVLARLSEQFGVTLDAQLIPSLDPEVFDTQVALVGANIRPIKVPIEVDVPGTGETTISEVDAWIVEMEGHTVTIPVDPNTAEGSALIQQWRENEYRLPVNLQARMDMYSASLDVEYWKQQQAANVLRLRATVSVDGFVGGWRGAPLPPVATGGLIHNGRVVRDNYPRFAKGTIIRGPGTGTSDSIIARVSAGEAITKARAVSYYGTRMMEDINNLRFPKFANGGFPMGTNAATGGNRGASVNVEVTQINPVTRDPLKQLREDSENLVAGLWGGN